MKGLCSLLVVVSFKNMDSKTEYQYFLQWLDEHENLRACFTGSQVKFAEQFFDILNEYPSLKEKISELGSKRDVFFLIERYLKSDYDHSKVAVIKPKPEVKKISDDDFIKKIKTI